MTLPGEFSFRTRELSLRRFEDDTFDLLVIGGGITGAAVARDAASRGLKVALVEKNDFAYGTSSRSSKLIHGGLRYLQNFEFGLVFEALAERALLLKTVPHMVRPLPFYLPVYEGDKNGKNILSMGLWLYDLLALFRTPGFHRRLSRAEMETEVPSLKREGLQGGFRYFDASMWDDVLAVETLRAAHTGGAAIANYCEAVSPIWNRDENAERIAGFRVRDLEKGRDIEIKAHRVVVCAGPWTDEMGAKLKPATAGQGGWKPWLNPSKGVHLIFDLKRIPLPGALVMSQPEDGRIAFVIPRPDYGTGVVIVGTTDGPTPADPDRAVVAKEDVEYLLGLLAKYFPELKLGVSDILSAYVGVRPLMGSVVPDSSEVGANGGNAAALQKVSREHHIGDGPGGTVIVAGGKYTTHRKMAEEIVDYTLKSWSRAFRSGKASRPPTVGPSRTVSAINPLATSDAIERCERDAAARGQRIPQQLLDRFGAEALQIVELAATNPSRKKDPESFPHLEAEFHHSLRNEMVMHLEDFYFRRVALFSSRADHGMPWAAELARVWAEERGLSAIDVDGEVQRLGAEIAKREAWRREFSE